MAITIRAAIIGAVIGGLFLIAATLIEKYAPAPKINRTPVGETEIIGVINPSPVSTHFEEYIALNDCIAAQHWVPYGEMETGFDEVVQVTPIPWPDCWYLYDWGIDVENGNLILDGLDVVEPGTYGIFYRIPENAIVTLTANLDLDIDGRFILGVFPMNDSPILSQQGISLDVWCGLTAECFMSLEKRSGSDVEHLFVEPTNGSDKVDIRVEILKAKLSAYVDGRLLNNEPVSALQPDAALFIGYSVSSLSKYTKVTISDLSIQLIR